jgi:autotransporter-associated beta strand protein
MKNLARQLTHHPIKVLDNTPNMPMKNTIPVLANPTCAASRRKDSAPRKLALACLVLLTLLGASAQAATSIKQNNTTALSLAGSWDVLPTAADFAKWDNTVTVPNTTYLLGNPVSWAGMLIANPGGLLTVNADANTLTLGTSGIDMTAATADFTLNCPVTLGGAQTRNDQLGRTLTVNGIVGGAFVLTKKGEGTLILNGANTHTFTTVGDGTTKKSFVSSSGQLRTT